MLLACSSDDKGTTGGFGATGSSGASSVSNGGANGTGTAPNQTNGLQASSLVPEGKWITCTTYSASYPTVITNECRCEVKNQGDIIVADPGGVLEVIPDCSDVDPRTQEQKDKLTARAIAERTTENYKPSITYPEEWAGICCADEDYPKRIRSRCYCVTSSDGINGCRATSTPIKVPSCTSDVTPIGKIFDNN